MRSKAQTFSDCLFASTLPAEVMDAVSANLSILKSPTFLRQRDGRLWAWEGTGDSQGLGDGTATHVWNYAQAIAHLFPDLERGLRETELLVDQSRNGQQLQRAFLPIRPPAEPNELGSPVADGQFGCVLKLYRDWRISGDDQWLHRLWPSAKRCIEFGIQTWDPARAGWLTEPQDNTYDKPFWGPNSFATSFYLAALSAAIDMADYLKDGDGYTYRDLLRKGRLKVEADLFNGEYFFQRTTWLGLRANLSSLMYSADVHSPEEMALAAEEGPKYQFGSGLMSDGVIGCWHASLYGVGVLDQAKVTSHLRAVFTHNFRSSLHDHIGIVGGTTSSATSEEGGLLNCSWPRGGRPTLSFPYASAVWTGVEYAAASHMIMAGLVQEGLTVVRTTRSLARSSAARNPRSPVDGLNGDIGMGERFLSYALLQALSGARYDAVTKTLHLRPRVRGDFKSFLAIDGGYGLVGVSNGRPVLEVMSGNIPYKKIDYVPA